MLPKQCLGLLWYPGKVVNIPSELKYTKSHEWVKIEGDTAVIGITDHAQSELGDVVFVDLPSPGRIVQAEESFGTVESVKTVSDLYAPIAGEVLEVNDMLGAQSELVNSDPYGNGWLLKIKIADGTSLDGLLSAEGYEASLDN
jgi:glycine cleavage system H protein